MTPAGSLLSAQASFELAALLVTWVAVAALVIVAGNLHARLRRLEQAGVSARPAPYGHLLGRRIADLLAGEPVAPRVLLFLSPDCPSCARLLDELAAPSRSGPAAIAWTGDEPPPRPPAPVVAHGARLAAELGIRVTPFALVAGEDGRVVSAGPVSSLRALGAVAIGRH